MWDIRNNESYSKRKICACSPFLKNITQNTETEWIKSGEFRSFIENFCGKQNNLTSSQNESKKQNKNQIMF